MTSNNGLGKVVLRDVAVAKTDTISGNGYSACRHGNGRDWWILAPHAWDTTVIYRYLLDPTGLHKVGEQDITTTYRGLGSAFFSPDGRWLARFQRWGFAPPYESTMNLYCFDRCTGLLSDRITYDYPGGNKDGGCAFSDDSKFLYVSVEDTIYQYELAAPDILASKEVVAAYDGFAGADGKKTKFFSMILAPDKKIYIVPTNSNRYLHVIEHPEKKGAACDVKQHKILLPTYNIFAIPNMPYYRLGKCTGCPCDSIGVAVNEPESPSQASAFSLHPNPATEEVQITLNQPALALAILDLQGREMLERTLKKGETDLVLPIEGLLPGCYFVRVRLVGGEAAARLLVVVR